MLYADRRQVTVISLCGCSTCGSTIFGTASTSASAIWTTGCPSFWGSGRKPVIWQAAVRCSSLWRATAVYPCDFYVLDEWRLGNIRETGLADMQNSETAKRFVRQSLAVPEECKTCQWFGLCRNGCRRDRDILPNGVIGQNIYCTAYKKNSSQSDSVSWHNRLSAFSVCSIGKRKILISL